MSFVGTHVQAWFHRGRTAVAANDGTFELDFVVENDVFLYEGSDMLLFLGS